MTDFWTKQFTSEEARKASGATPDNLKNWTTRFGYITGVAKPEGKRGLLYTFRQIMQAAIMQKLTAADMVHSFAARIAFQYIADTSGLHFPEGSTMIVAVPEMEAAVIVNATNETSLDALRRHVVPGRFDMAVVVLDVTEIERGVRRALGLPPEVERREKDEEELDVGEIVDDGH